MATFNEGKRRFRKSWGTPKSSILIRSSTINHQFWNGDPQMLNLWDVIGYVINIDQQ